MFVVFQNQHYRLILLLYFEFELMNQQNRFDNLSSKSRQDNIINNRIDNIEYGLSQLCEQQDSLANLIYLLQSMPVIKKTQQTLKTLQNQLNQSYKVQQQLESTILQNQNTNLVSSLERNFKMINSNLHQLKNSINEADSHLQNMKTMREVQAKQESVVVLKNVNAKYERVKKQMQKILQDFQTDISTNKFDQQYQQIRAEKVKIYVNNVCDNYRDEIFKLYGQIGGIRCQLEFNKDKNRKSLILGLLEKYSDVTNQNHQKYLLGVVEENVFLQQLSAFHKNKSNEMIKELKKIGNRLEVYIKFLEKHKTLSEEQRAHMIRQIQYLNDRWFSIKNLLAANRKKYLIETRKLQEKLVDLRSLQNQMKFDTKYLNEAHKNLQLIQMKMNQLDHSIGLQVKNTVQMQVQIGKLKEKIQKILC